MKRLRISHLKKLSACLLTAALLVQAAVPAPAAQGLEVYRSQAAAARQAEEAEQNKAAEKEAERMEENSAGRLPATSSNSAEKEKTDKVSQKTVPDEREEVLFDLSRGDVVIRSEGASGYDEEGNVVKASPSDAWTVMQTDPETSTAHTVTIRDGSSRVVLQGINLDYAAGDRPAIDIQAGAEAVLVLEGDNRVRQANGSKFAAVHAGKGAILQIAEESTGSIKVESAGNGAAIGGNDHEAGGTITIDGGEVSVETGYYGAGIGGGSYGLSGIIRINGGTVNAASTKNISSGCAIGGGYFGYLDEITITGGNVTAKGIWGVTAIGEYQFNPKYTRGTVTISGGVVDAAGAFQGSCIAAKHIKIQGDAEVRARGANYNSSLICKQFDMDGGKLTIEQSGYLGACIEATHGNIAGGKIMAHSSAENGLKGNFTITGGWIDAVGGNDYENGYSAIGGGNSNTIITGGTVSATGGSWSPGIGGNGDRSSVAAEKVTITGGSVRAVPGQYAEYAIGNGKKCTKMPVWPTDGTKRIYPVVIRDVEDLAELTVDGRTAEELGIYEYHSEADQDLCVYLPEGSHAIDTGKGIHTVDVKPVYALALNEASKTGDPGPYSPGDAIQVKAKEPKKGYVFLTWKAEGADGTEELFADAGSMETTFTMPAADVLLEPVYGPVIDSIEVIREPDQMNYREGDPLSLDGLEVRLNGTDGSQKTVTPDEFDQLGIRTDIREGSRLPYSRNGHPIRVFYGEWSASTSGTLSIEPAMEVTVEIGGVKAAPDPADKTGHQLLVELPFGTGMLPEDPEEVKITVRHGKAEKPVTRDGGRTWSFVAVNSAGGAEEYTVSVTVGEEKFDIPVRVIDGETAGALEGVYLEAVNETGNVMSARTGKDGTAVLKLKRGSYRISAVKDGYLLRSAQVEAGPAAEPEGGPLTIPLNTRGTVQGEVTAKEMSRQEIEEAGIDPDAEENRQLFRFSVNLEFSSGGGGSAGTIPFTYIGRPGGIPVGNTGFAGTVNGGRVTVYPVSEQFYLIIYGETGWLKEMFEVELAVINHSAVEEIRDCTAALYLPEGLSLAAMEGKEQEETIRIGTILPKRTAHAHWYVRGDEEGSYSLSVRVKGAFVSGGADPQPFDYLFAPKNPVEVQAGSALHLTIEVEDRTWNQDDYHVNFILENVSDNPVNDLTFRLTGEEQYRVSRWGNAGELEVYKQEDLAQGLVVEELEPGESIQLGFTTIIEFNSQIWRDPEYALTNMFLNVLEGSTTVIPHTFVVKRGYRSSRSKALASGEFPGLVNIADGDPVDLLSGAFTWSRQDMAVYGGDSLTYEREYRSDISDRTGRLGAGWTDNYFWKIETSEKKEELTGGKVVSLLMPGGERTFFYSDENGGYESREGSRYTLKESYDSWILTELEGGERVFDSSGYLRRIKTADGNVTDISYQNGRMRSVRSRAGFLNFSYDGKGRLLSVKDSAGFHVSYQYDAAGLLTGFTNQDGETFRYQYKEGFLTSMTAPDGTRAIENEYDEDGRVVRQEVPGQGEFLYTYDREKRENTCTGENGYERKIRYDSQDRILWESDGAGIRQYEYNEKNERISETDPQGIKTSREYDRHGRLSRILYGNGSWEDYTYTEEGRTASVTDQAGITISYAYDEEGRPVSYTDPAGGVWRAAYDEAGNLEAETDPLGGTTRYTYDEKGRRTGAEDPSGRKLVYEYDALGRLTGVTGPEGGHSSYRYTAAGKRENIVDAMGNEWKETVDARGLVTKRMDPENRETRYEYDGQSRLTKVTSASGAVTEFRYDTAGHLVSQTDGNGHTASFRYDFAGNLAEESDGEGGTTRYEYDGAGRVVSMTDPAGRTTGYTYDSMGQMSSMTDPLGRTVRYEYDAMGNRTGIIYPDGSREETEYDRMGRVIRETDAGGGSLRYEYDGAGRLTCAVDRNGGRSYYEYDKTGRLITFTDPAGYAVHYSYGAGNRPSAVTDQEGNTTEYEYDVLGRLIKTVDSAGTTVFTYDVYGNRTGVTDRDGNVTGYTYDGEGRLTAVAYPDGTTRTMGYDGAGNLLWETDGNGNRTEYLYDGADRLLSSTDGAGHTTARSYDEAGRLTELTDASGGVTRYRYDDGGRLTGVTDALGNTVRYEYDEMDRVIRMTDARGHETSYEYDSRGNETKITDPLGNETVFTYDAAGNRLSAANGDGTAVFYYDARNLLIQSVAPDGLATEYEYDKAGRLKAVTDANGNTMGYTYDGTGRLTGTVDALGGKTAYTYNGTGQPLTFTDAIGGVTRYTYDAVGRLSRLEYPDGSYETYTYDGNGNRTAMTDGDGNRTVYAWNAMNLPEHIRYQSGREASFTYDAMGRLTKAEDWTGTTTLEYDALGRLVTTADSRGNVVKNRYDAMGNRVGLTYPGGGEISCGYDAAGNLSTVTRDGKTTAYDYDSQGRPVRRSDPDGTEERYEYDRRGNLLSIIQTSEGGDRIRHQYQYDKVGNRISETGEGGAWEYRYDGLDRLISGTAATGGQNYAFRYDAAGNMIQSSRGGETTAYEVNQAGQVTEAAVTGPDGKISRTAYRYDGRGNRIEERGPAGTVTYSYDEAGYFSGAAGSANRGYQYNSLGVLVSRGEEWLVEDYASSPNRVLEIQGEKGLTKRFVYGNGRIGLEAEKGEEKGYWSLYGDALGSTEEAREINGVRSGSSTYDPWGNVSEASRVEFAGMELDVTTGYTGYLYDEVLGINYANARMYDNGTGRFLSRDPKQGTMSDPMSRNTYLYARANPFRYTDPTGMSFISQAGTVVTQAVGAGRQLYRGAAALGHRVKQTWNRVMGDQVSYYPVLECGMIRYAAVTQRGLGSRIKQGFGGVMMIVGGADFVLTGGGIIVGSEGLGTYLGGGMIAAGISSIGYGTAELMEAFTDYNPVRDGIMTGNRKLYYGGMNATNIAMLGLGLANLGYQLYGTYGGAVKAKAGEFFADETGGGIGKGGRGALEGPEKPSSQITGTSYDINKLNKTQPYVDEAKVSAIMAEITEYGPDAVPPIPVRVHDGQVLIIDGHHRFEAFKQLGYDRVPIKYIHGNQLGKIQSDGFTYYRSLQELLDGLVD